MIGFLPVSKADMKEAGLEILDFIFITGSAYVDHPSFDAALISRLLSAHGYSVGIIAQPNLEKNEDFTRLSKPRLGFLISSGNLDSSLRLYTSEHHRRHFDEYSPGGKIGRLPNNAVICYTKKIKEIFPETPAIIGGIEASLRRLTHYDYWEDRLRESILIESGADILVYGMGEKAILEIAAELHRGVPINALQDIKGTAIKVPCFDYIYDYVKLPSYEDCLKNKKNFALQEKINYMEQNPFLGKRLAQKVKDAVVAVNPPALPLTTEEMDEVYNLPFMRTYHPMYEKQGGVPAIEEVRFSITAHRGCFGGCNFCAIHYHEGRIIQKRSDDSILSEAKLLSELPNFKGYIHDVGGPTANFHRPSCEGQFERGACKGKSCINCKNLKADHSEYITLLRKMRAISKIKKVFIRSGVRYDYLLKAKDGDKFLDELAKYHISGQLKIAPEHISDSVLKAMGKSPKTFYTKFIEKFTKVNERIKKKQYLVPYFMSSHPGATLKDAIELAVFLKKHNYKIRQVQDFIPTPGTISTAMYYTGINPLTGEKIYVAKTKKEKAMQRALLQYWDKRNYALVKKALMSEKRTDLIQFLYNNAKNSL
ncbi:MAG: YgiQ family radical SAM protein [Selenomonadaceae bacterium]|nr:YgiQ family radical SAM protein [Selenomonadaceae bacterium]